MADKIKAKTKKSLPEMMPRLSPVISVAAGAGAFLSTPALSALGWAGAAGAALIGLGTGLGAIVVGGIGALGGLVVGGVALGIAGTVFNGVKNMKPSFRKGGMFGATVGALAGMVLGGANGYVMSKEIVMEGIKDADVAPIEMPSGIFDGLSAKIDANKAFAASDTLSGFDKAPEFVPVRAKPVAFTA